MVTQVSPANNATALVPRETTDAPAAEAGAARAALTDALPLLAGIVPFGMAIGVAVSDTAVHDGAGWAGSLLLFSGSAHMAAVSALAAGAGAIAVVATVLLVNARLAIYSALLAPAFRAQPRWFRWVAPYFVLDQTYALVAVRLEEGRDRAWVRRYYLTVGLGVLVVWPAAMAVGVLAGPVIPSGWHLAIAAPLLLTGLLAPALTNRTTIAVVLVAAVVALAARALPGGAGLLLGTAAGTAVGAWLERRAR